MLTVAEWNRLQEAEAARAGRRIGQASRGSEVLTVAEWNRLQEAEALRAARQVGAAMPWHKGHGHIPTKKVPGPDVYSQYAGPPSPDEVPVCPIPWHPNIWQPVFYGYQDHTPGVGDDPPVKIRIIYPSVDTGSDAPILGCSSYPLIIFCHGQCLADPDVYLNWVYPLGILARAGYVVALPELSEITQGDPAGEGVLETLSSVALWMLGGWQSPGWQGAGSIDKSSIGVAGHSRGAVAGAKLIEFLNGGKAYASLSGAFADIPDKDSKQLVDSISVPLLFTIGDGENTEMEAPEGLQLLDNNKNSQYQHRVIFHSGEHWDYLPFGVCSDDGGYSGPCKFAQAEFAADILATFFSTYMPPVNLPGSLNSLVPPTLQQIQAVNAGLPFENELELYRGLYMDGASEYQNDGCSATFYWTIMGQSGSVPFP